MDIFTPLETALYSKLTTTAGTALWSTRVFNIIAPQSTAKPYVVFAHVAGGLQNLDASGYTDVVYRVECNAATLAAASSGVAYIGSALHDQALTVTGWNHIATTEGDLFDRSNPIDTVPYYRRGAFYRIRICK